MDLTIGEIAAACGGKLVLQKRGQQEVCSDTCVSSVAIDSRKAEAGGVFVAVSGEHVDGHSFAVSVFEKGVVLVITQKTPEEAERDHGCAREQWGSYLLVEDTLRALRDAAEAYRKKLDIKVVGITGSSGKTSTKELIAAVLSEKYRVLKTEGNLNNEIGVPLTLLKIRREHQAAVVEMGISDFGEMSRLSKMARPDICVITNIGQSHLKDLKTRDGILKAKSEIFEYMQEDGEICLNGDDDKLIAVKEVKGHRPHFFGLGENAGQEVRVEESTGRGLWGSDAVMLVEHTVLKGASRREEKEKKGESRTRMHLHIPLPGGHMVQNAAAAVCVAGLLGLTEQEIAAGLAGARPVSGRDNLIRLPRYTLIDGCYNANPASMTAAVDLLAMADTEKVAVLGDMFNLGENSGEYHRQIGIHAVKAGIHRVICVGEESRHMFRGAQETLGTGESAEDGSAFRTGETAPRVLYFPDRQTFMSVLRENFQCLIPEGGTILVKASHGMEFTEILEYLQEPACSSR